MSAEAEDDGAAAEGGRRTAPVPDAGTTGRVDQWLAAVWPDLTRTRIKALIDAGRLTLDAAPLDDPAAKVRAGGRYVLDVPAPTPAIPQPEPIPLSVLFEDAHLIVIDKPPGLPAHPAAGHWTGTLVHALLHHCAGSLSGIGGVERPGIVHRLDKDTSGVMVAAKSDAAHHGLAALFADHDLERGYVALTAGAPSPPAGRLETKLGRAPHDRLRQTVLPLEDPRGKRAVTHYETCARFGQVAGASAGKPIASLVRATLETGRTHQIRVHLAHLGAPLLGDPLYGGMRGNLQRFRDAPDAVHRFQRQALHAAVLGFRHPITGEDLRFETEPPADMRALATWLETV